MSRPALLPTPASSIDIKGREGNKVAIQMSFELPPPVIDTSRPSSVSAQSSSASSYHSNSPLSPAMRTVETPSRRKPTASTATTATKEKENFTLPPPPARSRKIIQMKPKEAEASATTKAAGGKRGEAGTKKQPSNTNVAKRKIARKTAHSLIERRRRSKMNEEFGVLKNLIPACTGEMHKLAILQASIDYVRYLEDCISKLKAQNTYASTPTAFGPPPIVRPSSYSESRASSPDHEGDTTMTDQGEPISPTSISQTSYSTPQTSYPAHPHPSPSPHLLPQDSSRDPNTRSYHQTPSPALLPQDSRHRTDSYSSYTSSARQYSFSASSTTSPCFGSLNARGYAGYGSTTYAESVGGRSNPGSALTSPVLGPQRDAGELDREATAALLMLGGSGRTVDRGRGMSVRDLLA